MTIIKNHFRLIIIALAFIALIARIAVCNQKFANEYLNIKYNEPVTFKCRINSFPKVYRSGISFNAKPLDPEISRHLVRINAKNGQNLHLGYGDIIKVRATFEKPTGKMNHGNFSFYDYLHSEGVGIVANADMIDLKFVKHGMLDPLYNIREKITYKFSKIFYPSEAGIANALVTGDKDEIPERIAESLRKSGVYHIVAVSGLHLNIIILFLSYALSKAGKKHSIIKAFIICIICSAFMLMFTGFGVSVKRASVMAAILCIAPICKRRYDPLTALALAAYVTIWNEPYIYKDLSFQLSFLSTLGIVFSLDLVKPLEKKKYYSFASPVIISTFAWLFTTIPLILNFGKISAISVISNLVIPPAVPVALGLSYVTAILSLLLPYPIAKISANVCSIPIRYILMMSEKFAQIPYSYINMNIHTFLIVAFVASSLSVAVYALIKAPKSKYRLTFLAFSALICVIMSVKNIIPSKIHADFINVGQGDCALVRTAEGVCFMLDCGSESVSDVAENCVIPYLDYLGVSKINAVMLSHYHNDHANGICSLIENNRLNMLILPDTIPANDEKAMQQDIIQSALKMKISIKFAGKNDKIYLDKYSQLDILNPTYKSYAEANNHSMVAKLSCFGKKILFTGDIGDTAIYNLKNNDIHADIVKMPHHGAFCIQAKNFAKKCGSQFAVVSCGVNNMYGHPNTETLNAFKNSEILRTDENKTINFEITNKKIIADSLAK